MSGVLIYSEKEAKRNTFAINKFKEELGVTLAINDYDGTADFITVSYTHLTLPTNSLV